jgi:hypothetical protein
MHSPIEFLLKRKRERKKINQKDSKILDGMPKVLEQEI